MSTAPPRWGRPGAHDAAFDLGTGAGVAAAVVLGASTGDGFVAAVALLVAAGPVVGATAALAMLATVIRWGTADLAAVAGDQAVLGSAVTGGPALAMAGSAAAAVALLLAAAPLQPRGGRWATSVALGLGAATLAAGPAISRPPDFAVRVVAAGVAVAAAAALPRVLADRPSLRRRLVPMGPLAGLLALVLTVAA